MTISLAVVSGVRVCTRRRFIRMALVRLQGAVNCSTRLYKPTLRSASSYVSHEEQYHRAVGIAVSTKITLDYS